MKPNFPVQRSEMLKGESGAQPVRLIKANHTGKQLHHPGADGASSAPKPEIRLIQSTADFCDLEIACGCGETTRVRCWTTAGPEEKSAR